MHLKLHKKSPLAAGLAAAFLLAVLMPAMMRAQAAADPAPINDRPNPYKTVSDWAKLPAGRAWGSSAGVAIDRHGHIWVAERCGANSCADSNLAPILEFDTSGKLLTSIGAGIFLFPHGIAVDKNGNIWVTDGQGAPGKGHQVIELSPAGQILMRLGKAGVAGNGPDTFNMPSGVAFAPNGDIFIADGHGGDSNNRIVKFSSDGKFLMTWGQKGAAPGEFDIPHDVVFDSHGRLWVADRNNNRIQIFDQQGHFISQLKTFSRPSGIAFDKKGNVYVCDSESESVSRNHDGWKRGMRIGTPDGTIKYFIPDPVEKATTTSAAEGCAVDAHGVIYGAEVGPKDLKKYVPRKHLSFN